MSITGTLFSTKDVATIQQRLQTLEPNTPGLWGQMTVHQAICHQADALEIVLGRRPAKPIKSSLPPFLLRAIALRLPFPWPHGVRTVREADQASDGTPPVDFTDDRARLDRLIQEFSKLEGNEAQLVHPIFGSMSRADWGRWAYRHSDHHLRQFGA